MGVFWDFYPRLFENIPWDFSPVGLGFFSWDGKSHKKATYVRSSRTGKLVTEFSSKTGAKVRAIKRGWYGVWCGAALESSALRWNWLWVALPFDSEAQKPPGERPFSYSRRNFRKTYSLDSFGKAVRDFFRQKSILTQNIDRDGSQGLIGLTQIRLSELEFPWNLEIQSD